jgi:hypothetical protein
MTSMWMMMFVNTIEVRLKLADKMRVKDRYMGTRKRFSVSERWNSGAIVDNCEARH